MMSKELIDTAMNITMSEEQWNVVSSPLAPAVIVAGAGSGKTTSMAARVAYLVSVAGVPPSSILGLTFTNKAAAALGAAVRTAVNAAYETTDDLEFPQVMTYNAFASRIVAEFGLRRGIEPDSQVLTDGAREHLAYRWICSVPPGRISDPTVLGNKPHTLTTMLLDLDNRLAELAVSPEALIAWDSELLEFLGPSPAQKSGQEMRETSLKRRVLAELVREWRDYKLSRAVMDFSDQLRYANELMATFPDIPTAIRERYRAVLLDEYQDTSIAQRHLMDALFGDGFALTAVGDPCQAIYGWRGASVDNIESFTRHFATPDLVPQVFTLRENRRSAPAILHHANDISSALRSQHRGVEPLAARATQHGEGDVLVGLFSSQSEEIEWITQHIAELRARESSESIAVLAGTAEHIVRIDAALRLSGIPTQVHGAAALLAQPAVRDVRAWLEIIHEPTANAAFLRIAAGPRWRLGPRDLAALGARAAELADSRGRSTATSVEEALNDAVEGGDTIEITSLTDALLDLGPAVADMSAEAVARCHELGALLTALRSYTYEPLAEFLLRVMSTIGIDVEVRVQQSTSQRVDFMQADALASFIEFASSYTEIDSRIGLGAFLVRLSEAERFDVRIELDQFVRAGAVQLMTIHKAKGLEFDHVVVPFVGKGIFPNGKGRSAWPTSASVVPWPLREDAPPGLHTFPDRSEGEVRAKHLNAYKDVLKALDEVEVDRLAYVALTRSHKSVAVTGHWWRAGRSTIIGPHRILEASFAYATGEQEHPGTARVVQWIDDPGPVNTDQQAESSAQPWPAPVTSDYRERLQSAAERVNAAHAMPAELPARESDRATADRWHRLMSALRAETQARLDPDRTVRLGPMVGATTFLRALRDPQAVALDTARPMPRQPSPAAARGTAWHAWVESTYGQRSLLDPDDLPGSADQDIVTDQQLSALQAAFEKSPYATMDPVAIERAFALVIAGRVVNGRIDAVFRTAEGYDVVDWKTGGTSSLDPRQLAIYRLAWATIAHVPWRTVDAAFVMVATGEVIRPDTDADVEALLAMMG